MLEPRVHLAPPNGGARHFNVYGTVSAVDLDRAASAGLGTLLRYR